MTFSSSVVNIIHDDSDLKIVRHPEQSEGSSTRKQEIPRFARNDIFIVGGEHHS
jgi:hypothetical protein